MNYLISDMREFGLQSDFCNCLLRDSIFLSVIYAPTWAVTFGPFRPLR
jgi:hypothetical protein